MSIRTYSTECDKLREATMAAQADNIRVEDHLDNVFDVLSDGIYITDSEGRTLKVNRVYEKLTGLHRDELVGRRVDSLREEGVFNAVLNPKIVSTGNPATSVQETRDGRRLVLSGYPIKNAWNKVLLVVTFVRDITVIGSLRDQVAEQRSLIDSYHERLKTLSEARRNVRAMVMESGAMHNLVARLDTVADTDATVLLLGETGVGKDVLARRVHAMSMRRDKPFFKVDCTTIPENLMESELFGYAPGAFSGASKKGRVGYFELARNGTLFLDELGELPLPMQAKLLRVLQDQEIMRVGDAAVRKVDVRIVAATNRNLEDEVARGAFRSDLFYRLKVAEMTVPPLRERREDIPALAERFLERFNTKHNKRKSFSAEARRRLLRHHWPGNVRELENMVQSVVVTSDKDVIDAEDLPISAFSQTNAPMAAMLPEGGGRNLKSLVSEYEYNLLSAAMDRLGSLNEVAAYFGVNRSTIFRKMRQFEDKAGAG